MTQSEGLKRLQDRLDIAELLSIYDVTTDDHDFEALAECFTRDGRLKHANGDVDIAGRDHILSHFRLRMESFTGPAIHLHHGHILRFMDDDSASGIVTASGMAVPADGATVSAHRYYDKYRFEDGRWRIQERVLHFWYRMKISELSEYLSSDLRMRVGASPRVADLPAFGKTGV